MGESGVKHRRDAFQIVGGRAALRNPTPESAIEASAREVFHPSRTDPVPTLRRPEGELAPSDSHRALEDPPSPQRGGVTDGADLTASAAKECRE